MIKKFKTKNYEFEAIQLRPDNVKEVLEFVKGKENIGNDFSPGTLYLRKDDGSKVTINIGDYVIIVDGKTSSCDWLTFYNTYEEV